MKIEVKHVADNNPGMIKRYGLREVSSHPEIPVCVTVDGLCNHADTDIEGNQRTDKVLVCTKCEAWRYVTDDWNPGWHNEFIRED